MSEIWKFGNLPLEEAIAELYQICISHHHPLVGSTLKAVHTAPERDLVIGGGGAMYDKGVIWLEGRYGRAEFGLLGGIFILAVARINFP